MRRQAEIAIETATVIIMVVDVTVGLTAADSEVAAMLKKSKKPVVLAVNKCDRTGGVNPEVYEFYSLGLGDPIEVSAVHGHGTGDILDACVENFPETDDEEYDEDVIKVAIIGKPNVGKSSLLNRILGEERVIVSNIAGTTRDAIDSYFENEFGKYLFIDTAGMRRKSKVDDAVEKYSNLRSVSAIERADVCLILIDANEGVTEQDTKVAGLAHEAGKACIRKFFLDHVNLFRYLSIKTNYHPDLKGILRKQVHLPLQHFPWSRFPTVRFLRFLPSVSMRLPKVLYLPHSMSDPDI